MNTVTSRDGTRIAYESLGSGPPLLLVDGAFCGRTFGPMPALAGLLKDHFSVVHYDRRGRGDSGDSPNYSVEKEIDDIRALVDTMAGEPFVYGTSSGAVLAARAVSAGIKAKKLALYEPPLALDGTHYPKPADYVDQIAHLLKEERRREAVKLFMRVVGMPGFAVFLMGLFPVFKGLTKVAHTLVYDFSVLGDTQRGGALPEELKQQLTRITVPTLALSGGKSPPWMKHAVEVVANTVSGESRTEVIPGQDHNIAAKAMAPKLMEFFAT